MQTRIPALATRVITAAALLAAASSVALRAESSSAEIRVTATVVARTLVQVESAPSAVSVTPADIQKGYVELSEPISVQVRSNARNGYLLRFEPLQGPFTSGEVSWNNNLVQLGGDERWISQAREQQGPAVMNVRLNLEPGMAPGVYPLNLNITGDSI